MKKKENENLTSFEGHLDMQYGKIGTDERERFEAEFEVIVTISQSAIPATPP